MLKFRFKMLFTLLVCISFTFLSLNFSVRASTIDDSLLNQQIEQSILSRYQQLMLESYNYYLKQLGFEIEKAPLKIQQFPVLVENNNITITHKPFYTARYFARLNNNIRKSKSNKKKISARVVKISNAPVGAGYLSSRFGFRKDPIHGKHRMHNGIDIAAKFGSKVNPLGEGKVVFAGYKSGFGNLVEIKHGYTVLTRYAHLKEFSVNIGQQVNSNDVIGLIGSSGRSTGPHLHLEVLFNGEQVDPQIFLVNHFGSRSYKITKVKQQPKNENKEMRPSKITVVAQNNKKSLLLKNRHLKIASNTTTSNTNYQKISYQDYVKSVDGLFGLSAPSSFNQ